MSADTLFDMQPYTVTHQKHTRQPEKKLFCFVLNLKIHQCKMIQCQHYDTCQPQQPKNTAPQTVIVAKPTTGE